MSLTPITDDAWEFAMQEQQDDDGTWADAARYMRDIATKLECDNIRLRAAIAAGIDEARSLDANTDSLVDGILSPALLLNVTHQPAEPRG